MIKFRGFSALAFAAAASAALAGDQSFEDFFGSYFHRTDTIAVGAISEADHVNSIVAAGRADLCAIARPHLADPAWTLHEVAKIGVADISWPKQYLSAKTQYEANLARAAAAQAGAA